jgi:hypothetical protein
MNLYKNEFDERTDDEIEFCDKLTYNSIELYGIYLDYFYLKIVTSLEEAQHLQIQYDLKYEKDCKRLNKMHSIHKFRIKELCNMNGIIIYSDTSEMLECLEFPQIEWI